MKAEPSGYARGLERLLGAWPGPKGRRRPAPGAPAGAALGILERVERDLSGGRGPSREAGREFLRVASAPRFLRELGRTDLRTRWAEAAFALIRATGYGVGDLFEDRVRETPGRVFLQDMSVSPPRLWTYEAAARHVRETAGALYALAGAEGVEPRLAIYAENHAEGAVADLACLCYDILDTPVNPHFSLENVVGICDALAVNMVLANDRERIGLLREARRRTARTFRILVTDPALDDGGEDIVFLTEYAKQLGARDVEARLARRRRGPRPCPWSDRKRSS